MRQLVYAVAASLDGFIAGPNGEYDWIVGDPTMDMAAMFRRYDTLLMGRKTYELAIAHGGDRLKNTGKKIVVVSGTLNPAQHPDATIIGSGVAEAVAALKSRPGTETGGKRSAERGPGTGNDIWLFGGGVLFRSLLDLGLVDRVEVGVNPVLIGGGIPLIPAGARCALRLEAHRIYPSGIVRLEYAVVGAPAEVKPRARADRHG
jgi:dihydrofolate reductase